jgi:aminopeptidase N
MKGAHFLRALENRVGRAELDAAIRTFYLAHRGTAARMQDMLDTIASETGYDPSACATAWLRGNPLPTEDTCP